jgi:gluconokinase
MVEQRDKGPAAAPARPRVLVVMGVSGCGKTTVAEALAARLGWEMLEGDRLHSPANVDKMRRGIPLDDADRAPWLDRIREHLAAWAKAGRSGIVTCSALKRAYRARLLAACPDILFVFLKGSEELLRQRLAVRHHEYMPASLLHSQFETLEEPGPDEPVITVDVGLPVEAEVEAIIKAAGLAGQG